MQVTRGYKTELDLNNVQTTACLKHAGAARWAYNWGLKRYQEEYAAGRKAPNAQSLHKELNALKQTELFWMYEVSKCAPQEALRSLETRSLDRLGVSLDGSFTSKKRQKGLEIPLRSDLRKRTR